MRWDICSTNNRLPVKIILLIIATNTYVLLGTQIPENVLYMNASNLTIFEVTPI